MAETTEKKAINEGGKSQVIQMRLQPRTLDRLQNLVKITKTTNKTQLVASSIELAEEIMKTLNAGGKVYIEKPNGQKDSLKIIGM